MKDNKKLYILIGVIVILLAGFLYFSSQRKKELSWDPTFINTDTNPYGTYITYQLLKDIFDGSVSYTRKPVYNNLKDKLDYYFYYEDEEDYELPRVNDENNYYGEEEEELSISINDSTLTDYYSYTELEKQDTMSYVFINLTFEIDKVDLNPLLDFVGMGNNVFISAEKITSVLTDTLGVEVKTDYFFSSTADTSYTLVDYPEKKYNFREINSASRLNIDSCKLPVRVLGLSGDKDTTFIQIKYGKGYFFLHTVPVAFTNYSQIDLSKYDYAYRCLSYLPKDHKILWDEYQKRPDYSQTSMFRTMLRNFPLLLALCITLLGFLLFMIFRAKRIQRVIPIIEPPVNSSIEFLETISNLYYRKKDFETIVEKRQAYLLDFIRKNYYMQTEVIDSNFVDILSAKTGVEKDTLNELFILYRNLSTAKYGISNEDFLQYNKLLEDFYRGIRNK